jgi:ribosomal-protein-alanine N-acetyltransferase
VNAAQLQPAPSLAPMTVAHLDAVLALEQQAYPFPWTRGNFIDSLAAGYMAEVLLDGGSLIAYYVAMHGVRETHLLNITVEPCRWGEGHGRRLLDRVVVRSRAMQGQTLWLEVRHSNLRARTMYQRYGFTQVGTRRGYYPAPHDQREDAIVMSLPLVPEGGRDGLD